MLERLTYTLRGDKQFARLTAVVFICSPATIFLSAIYSEALFAAMAFTGCWLYAHRRFWSAAVFFALATCTRGNGIIFCGFFIVDFLQAVRSRSPCGFLVGKVVATGMQITLVLAPYVLYQVSSAQLYCSGAVTDAAYCTAFFPNIYGHIQATYWGVGFLKIYRVEQIPNFLLAGPVLFLSIKTVYVYVSANTTLFFTGGLIGENRNYSKDKFLERPVALTYFYHWAAALLICLTVLHIQVSTRFLTSVPAFHWAVAESIRHAGSGPAVAWKVWLAGYTVVGSVLFSAFYPWT
jgi:phosphatidylinositol glycan class V